MQVAKNFQEIKTTTMNTRTSRLATNFNNKLCCPFFIHLDVAPAQGIPESVLNETIYTIVTEDDSHPPVKAKLVDLARLELGKVSDVITWQSHGMTTQQYLSYLEERGTEIKSEDKMSVYLFQQIHPSS
jgi:rRNA processing protein Gar1